MLQKFWSWRIRVSIPVLPACKAGAFSKAIRSLDIRFSEKQIKLQWNGFCESCRTISFFFYPYAYRDKKKEGKQIHPRKEEK